jgi:hypothetical protein
MTAMARWSDAAEPRTVSPEALPDLWREIASEIDDPVVLLLAAGGAELGAVVGDRSGSVLTYRPPNYEGIGSLHTIGDRDAANRDAWEPAVTAYFFGQHTEFPRYSVVSTTHAIRAVAEFCESPTSPPSAVVWDPD